MFGIGTPCSERPCPRTAGGEHSWSRNDGQQCGSCGCWKSSRGRGAPSQTDDAKRARLRRRNEKKRGK